MDVRQFDSKELREILSKLDRIEKSIVAIEENIIPQDTFLDNQEFLQLMNISKRTAQNWRDQGIIPYSQIGSKIYYRMSDVKALLESTYNNKKLKESF